ncbi:hypothetical protein [Thalassobacillus pellis]|uniref:hypothetical protein n=1 Tax=Thalassobacillus pellis TaxID=748008 RepID=UPI00195F61CC|nr:hypothetical protein [Thalassobacillus pellis]MBM7554002.1 hypothetical protein [Thalassobacillus pellis]
MSLRGMMRVVDQIDRMLSDSSSIKQNPKKMFKEFERMIGKFDNFYLNEMRDIEKRVEKKARKIQNFFE